MLNKPGEFIKIWKPILEDLEFYYPFIIDEMIDWYPSGQLEITVKTKDGTKIAYDYISKSIMTVYIPNSKCINPDERDWRKWFAANLNRKIQLVGKSQEELSELTNISKVTLSKYTNGKTTPSGYNIHKLARALRCSISELMNIR